MVLFGRRFPSAVPILLVICKTSGLRCWSNVALGQDGLVHLELDRVEAKVG
jgi:hypothetical protein